MLVKKAKFFSFIRTQLLILVLLYPLSGTLYATQLWIIGTSIPAIEEIVKSITGLLPDSDITIETQSILHNGDDPHFYSLKPSDIRKISHFKIYFKINLAFENIFLRKVAAINQDVQIFSCLGLEQSHSTSDDHHKEDNTHSWIDPLINKAIGKCIFEHLAKLQPSKEQLYQRNYLRFAKRMDALDHFIKSSLIKKDAPQRPIYTFHDIFYQLAKRYHGTGQPYQLPIVSLQGNVHYQPTLQEIRHFSHQLKKANNPLLVLTSGHGEEKTLALIKEHYELHEEDHFQIFSIRPIDHDIMKQLKNLFIQYKNTNS